MPIGLTLWEAVKSRIRTAVMNYSGNKLFTSGIIGLNIFCIIKIAVNLSVPPNKKCFIFATKT
jgi:hypothetical protein